LCSFFLLACGGYSNSSSTAPITSGLANRAFVSNVFSGAIDIINANSDSLNTHRIIGDGGPKYMALSPDKSATLVFTSSSNLIDAVDNKGETVAGRLQLQSAVGAPQGFFALGDNQRIYVAERNAGVVVQWDTKAGTTTTITVPNALRIVRSNNSKYVLAFPDDNSNTVYFIDTTATTLTAVAVTGFDRPVYAVFSPDDTFAYVVNCGLQCGGTQAGIQILNTPALTLGNHLNLAAADFALLNGSTLYVPGTAPGMACTAAPAIRCGLLSVVNASATPTLAMPPFQISDGYHDHMLLAPNNRLYIGAEYTCAAIAPNGCLSIFNTSSHAVVIVPPCASACNELNDISGMTNITGRTVVYVIEGGEVHVYDTATDAQKPGVTIDTVGRSWDVVNPD
jgi:hypothetical protein